MHDNHPPLRLFFLAPYRHAMDVVSVKGYACTTLAQAEEYATEIARIEAASNRACLEMGDEVKATAYNPATRQTFTVYVNAKGRATSFDWDKR